MTKKHSLFGKIISAVLAVSMLVTATIGLGSTSASAASAKIFSDDNATVVLNEDGSGVITLNKEFTEENPLTEIAGVPLKEIITFNDGGYIDTFYTKYVGDIMHVDPQGGVSSHGYKYAIFVEGCGPSGLTSGSGHLHFTDKEPDTYNLAIWSSLHYSHYVQYNSDDPMIVKIAWNS